MNYSGSRKGEFLQSFNNPAWCQTDAFVWEDNRSKFWTVQTENTLIRHFYCHFLYFKCDKQ